MRTEAEIRAKLDLAYKKYQELPETLATEQDEMTCDVCIVTLAALSWVLGGPDAGEKSEIRTVTPEIRTSAKTPSKRTRRTPRVRSRRVH